jgi:hypothetical protein
METVLSVSQGTFDLQRLPQRKNEKLRAWDAADEYLLAHVSENLALNTSISSVKSVALISSNCSRG